MKKENGRSFLVAAVLSAGVLLLPAAPWAARGGVPGPPEGGGGGGNRPPVEVSNNLSYPGALVPGITIDPYFQVAEGTLGETYSYGCDTPQTIIVGGTAFNYPNTTCVTGTDPDTGEALGWLTAEECTAVGAPCAGYDVDRIYWQKETENTWSAEATGFTAGPLDVSNLDWGDSIESNTWNENSILRVETQPFTIMEDDLGIFQQTGFQMWHAEGQGITEQWGVRTTEVCDETNGVCVQGLPYVYYSEYAIINAGPADLYITKLFKESADAMGGCPTPGTTPVYPTGWPFTGFTWLSGAGWVSADGSACNYVQDLDYTIELSVSGKYVHGYNWRIRDYRNPLDALICVPAPGEGGWDKTGWWRLTFVPNGGASKMTLHAETATGAPEVPGAVPTDLTILSEEGEDEVSMYAPVILPTENLSYIDLCIQAKPRGKK